VVALLEPSRADDDADPTVMSDHDTIHKPDGTQVT